MLDYPLQVMAYIIMGWQGESISEAREKKTAFISFQVSVWDVDDVMAEGELELIMQL